MGWGRTMLTGNTAQSLEVQDVTRAIGQMQAAFRPPEFPDRRQDREYDALRREHQEMKMYLAILVKLLVAKGLIRQEEIDAAVQAVEKS